ncbi:hypothetical protein PoB_002791000 [Plakobranchus ocellatus]|uniref:Uncharacterized protein n=1 Tax=Plakobranchus ocellatus TaxID=259542 RepID=A0AAV3ZZV8_9GAST|nr:hypothetical protein PoB_002791000 [Plakobranchus ocellatus]
MNEPDNIQESNLPRHNIDNREHDDAAHKLDEIVSALDHTRNLLENYLESTKRSGNLNKQIARRGKSWWGRHCWPNGRRFLYRYITLITVALQFLNLMILTIIDIMPGHNDKEYRMLLTLTY